MKLKNIFNSMGYAGQLGNLGTIIETMKNKLDGVQANAEENKIDTVKVNGNSLPITNKAVNIDLSDLENLCALAKVTVTFDTHGGSEVAPMTVSYGQYVDAPNPPPTKEGFNLLGWSNNYGDPPLPTPYGPAKRNMILHACWEATGGGE